MRFFLAPVAVAVAVFVHRTKGSHYCGEKLLLYRKTAVLWVIERAGKGRPVSPVILHCFPPSDGADGRTGGHERTGGRREDDGRPITRLIECGQVKRTADDDNSIDILRRETNIVDLHCVKSRAACASSRSSPCRRPRRETPRDRRL